jgi:hypothetical protein
VLLITRQQIFYFFHKHFKVAKFLTEIQPMAFINCVPQLTISLVVGNERSGEGTSLCLVINQFNLLKIKGKDYPQAKKEISKGSLSLGSQSEIIHVTLKYLEMFLRL